MSFITYIVNIDTGRKVSLVPVRGRPGQFRAGTVNSTMSAEQIAERVQNVRRGIEDALAVHGGTIDCEFDISSQLVVSTTVSGMEAIRQIGGVGSVNPSRNNYRPTGP